MLASIPNWLFITFEVLACCGIAIALFAVWLIWDGYREVKRSRAQIRRSIDRIEREMARDARFERRA